MTQDGMPFRLCTELSSHGTGVGNGFHAWKRVQTVLYPDSFNLVTVILLEITLLEDVR